MKICVIKDESANNLEIGYLFYFEKSKQFSIELSEMITEQQVPLMFAHFIQEKTFTVSPAWSRRWVRQRIVPEERQNIGMILRENRIDHYDEYRMLMLGEGRCAQDDCMVSKVQEIRLPQWVSDRLKRKLDFTIPISAENLLVCFRDQSMRIIPVALFQPEIKPPLEIRQLAGGVGILINEERFVDAQNLYCSGRGLQIDKKEFRNAVKSYLLDTSEVCERMQCSRQYVNVLVKNNDLPVFKEIGNNRLYEYPEVERLKE